MGIPKAHQSYAENIGETETEAQDRNILAVSNEKKIDIIYRSGNSPAH